MYNLKVRQKAEYYGIGEAASMACLETKQQGNSLAKIIGLGFATEILEHNISISSNAECFQRSMRRAFGDLNPSEVDAVVLHAPGTIKGDFSEFAAIEKVFGPHLPALTTNKWKVGQSIGASGMLSLELAILMIRHQEFIPVVFVNYSHLPKRIDKVMINTVCFDGNAVSILIEKV
ncbi:hypothetical protein GCM10007383_33840 [Arenibacter certesii]|uniref:Beta-ketoacyl synthase C-terminal domain-containing protein n=1 Tax=Arenibacter certesii TaxID=228955 RepID=A0A918MQA8_9FLAO|nr:hypothetical protein [Arenibacter certesii]GGW46803.1 hypothetical protein GCM10007383_33840 [Arenibacter certesii]